MLIIAFIYYWLSGGIVIFLIFSPIYTNALGTFHLFKPFRMASVHANSGFVFYVRDNAKSTNSLVCHPLSFKRSCFVRAFLSFINFLINHSQFHDIFLVIVTAQTLPYEIYHHNVEGPSLLTDLSSDTTAPLAPILFNT